MNEMMSGSNKLYSAFFFAVFQRVTGTSISLIKNFVSLIKKSIACMKQWKQNYRTRRQLAELPKYLYQDVGLSPEKVQKNFTNHSGINALY
ncbi:DUF1127 domain-containing protein [Vibrio sp. PP-XX7]